jgi:hypothetical protein
MWLASYGEGISVGGGVEIVSAFEYFLRVGGRGDTCGILNDSDSAHQLRPDGLNRPIERDAAPGGPPVHARGGLAALAARDLWGCFLVGLVRPVCCGRLHCCTTGMLVGSAASTSRCDWLLSVSLPSDAT